jgi:hypothetical protein
MRCSTGWDLYKLWLYAAAESLREGKALGLTGASLLSFQSHTDRYQRAFSEYVQHIAGCDQCKAAIRSASPV